MPEQTKVLSPITLKAGDMVTFKPHPPRQARWWIVEIPVNPVGSDIALLEAVDLRNPLDAPRRIRRWVRDLTFVEESHLGSARR